MLLIERWVERNGEIVHEVRLPKGHVDPGETDEQAARRETCEESGYCAVEVLADLGTIVTEFDKLRRRRTEHVRRTEHYFLMRLTDEHRSEPNFQSADEARFQPKWVAGPGRGRAPADLRLREGVRQPCSRPRPRVPGHPARLTGGTP